MIFPACTARRWQSNHCAVQGRGTHLFRSRRVTCWVLEKFQWIDGKMGTRSLLSGADTTYSSSFSGVPAFTVPIQVQGRLLLHWGGTEEERVKQYE